MSWILDSFCILCRIKMMTFLDIYSEEKKNTFLRFRPNEMKFGTQVQTIVGGDFEKGLDQFQKSGGRFVVLGIPEDIGVQANYGRPGTREAWNVFLDGFLNRQENRFLHGENVLLLGEVYVKDIYESFSETQTLSLEQMGLVVEEVDTRVLQTLKPLFERRLIPIVIGGGHNNAYGCLRAASEVFRTFVDCVNIDPHADYRLDSWRHSGNAFSFADREGYLGKYSLVGAQKNYNSESMIKALEKRPDTQVQFWENIDSLEKTRAKVIHFLNDKRPIGLELDTDSIVGMPVSAFTSIGFSNNEVFRMIRHFSAALKPCYFHVAEAAPFIHQDGGRGADIVKKSLPAFVCEFIENG